MAEVVLTVLNKVFADGTRAVHDLYNRFDISGVPAVVLFHVASSPASPGTCSRRPGWTGRPSGGSSCGWCSRWARRPSPPSPSSSSSGCGTISWCRSSSPGTARLSRFAIGRRLGQFGSNIGVIAPGAFISMAVPLAVFFAFQRHFEAGLLGGSVK